MSSSTYKVTEIVGTAPESIEQAIRNALEKASQSLHGLDWFEVQEVRGTIAEGSVGSFQVLLKVGFKLD